MAHTFNSKLSLIAANYVQLIQAKVTTTTIKKEIVEDPYYPSLLALSNTYSRYNIDSIAYHISKEEFTEIASETPFVAYTKLTNVGNDFVLVTQIEHETVSYKYKNKKIQTVSSVDFLNKFQNVVWKAELNEQSGEIDFNEKRQEEKNNVNKSFLFILIAILLILLVISVNLPQKNILSFCIIAILKIIGITGAILILIFDIDKNNSFVKNLCSVGGKTNCDAVLSSKVSKVFGIGWGEIGFYYFASTLLGLLLPSISFETKVTCIAIGNAFAVPYILFSIYYQWRIIKQWCILCLMIQFVLASELIWSVLVVWQLPLFNIFKISTLIEILFCSFVPILLWNILKPILTKSKDHDLYKPAYKRLQYNPEIFKSLLLQQDKIPDGWQKLGIDIGNVEAKNTLIKICNPYCKPCEDSHSKLEYIIEQNKDVKLKIIYISYNNEYDKGAVIVKHLLSIASEGNASKMKNALDDWYLKVGKDYDLFAKKYPINNNNEEVGEKIDDMSHWCDIANITHTPTVFLNGYRLPENYSIDDLKIIL